MNFNFFDLFTIVPLAFLFYTLLQRSKTIFYIFPYMEYIILSTVTLLLIIIFLYFNVDVVYAMSPEGFGGSDSEGN